MATRSWNRVELIGNLTRDPEVRFTPNGAAVATFSIATNRTYVTDGERKEEVDYHRIVAWNKLAELCGQLLKKGNRVFVSGRLQNRSWEDQAGQSRQVTEIVIEDMIVLTSKGASESSEEDRDFRPSKEANEDVSPKEDKNPSAEVPAEEKKEKSPEEGSEDKKSKKSAEAEKEDIDVDDLPF